MQSRKQFLLKAKARVARQEKIDRVMHPIKKLTAFIWIVSLIGISLAALQETPSGIAQVIASSEPDVSPTPTEIPTPQTIEEIIRVTAKAYGMTKKQENQLVCIAKAESGLRANAIGPINKNGTRDWGLLQVNDIHIPKLKDIGEKPDPELLLSPFINLRIGIRIYKESGPQAWSVYKVKGLCK